MACFMVSVKEFAPPQLRSFCSVAQSLRFIIARSLVQIRQGSQTVINSAGGVYDLDVVGTGFGAADSGSLPT